MTTPLAWRNVLHSRMRSFVALAGVSFSIVLIFMQLGFRDAGRLSATLVFNKLDFDLMVISRQYLFLSRCRSFPNAILERVRAFPEIRSATPLWLGTGDWRSLDSREGWPMLVLGADLGDRPFLDPEVNNQMGCLGQVDNVLTDRLSRPEFDEVETGIVSEIAGHRVNVAGRFTMGGGFVAGSTLIASDRTFARIFPLQDLEQVNFGLLKLQPGAQPDLIDGLNAAVAPEARVIARRDLTACEESYWMDVRPIGIMFSSGLLISLISGGVILYQVLVNEVHTRIREYETLLAIGYGRGQVYAVVFRQSFIYAVLGYAPAVALADGIYALLRWRALLPVTMEWSRVGNVFGLTIAMCLLATFLAVRKLGSADPAGLFG